MSFSVEFFSVIANYIIEVKGAMTLITINHVMNHAQRNGFPVNKSHLQKVYYKFKKLCVDCSMFQNEPTLLANAMRRFGKEYKFSPDTIDIFAQAGRCVNDAKTPVTYLLHLDAIDETIATFTITGPKCRVLNKLQKITITSSKNKKQKHATINFTN